MIEKKYSEAETDSSDAERCLCQVLEESKRNSAATRKISEYGLGAACGRGLQDIQQG